MPRSSKDDFLEYHTQRAQQERDLIKYLMFEGNDRIRREAVKRARARKKYHEKLVQDHRRWRADRGLST